MLRFHLRPERKTECVNDVTYYRIYVTYALINELTFVS
jgi:hypothetical protein